MVSSKMELCRLQSRGLTFLRHRDWEIILVFEKRYCILGGASGEESASNAGDIRGTGSIPRLGRSWRRAWQPTPVFLPGESHRQRSLVGYSPWGHKESDTTEATAHTHIS